MNNNEQQAYLFLQLVSDKYEELYRKWLKYNIERKLNVSKDDFDDLFQDTILKIFEKIKKDGIEDSTNQGLVNYFFKSLNTNIKREKQYSRNSKRDNNIDSIEYLDNKLDENDIEIKKKEEARQQYITYRILELVEKEFDNISFRCFRLYYLTKKMSYKKLIETTKVKDAKKRVVTIKKWLQENIDKHLLEKEFNNWYEENNKTFW